MNENYDSSRKIRDTIVIVVLSITITFLVIVFVIPWVSSQIQHLSTTHLISIFGLIVTGIGVAWKLVLYRLQSSCKAKVTVNVRAEKRNAIVTAAVENIGTKRIIPHNVYLVVDEGIKRKGYFEFPFLLRHEQGEWDCIMAKICKQGKLQYPRDLLSKDFTDVYADFIPLRHLSTESILFIDPKEKFIEDTILRLPKSGAYRVMLIFTARNCECVCASREFLV